jgi:cytochrome P450
VKRALTGLRTLQRDPLTFFGDRAQEHGGTARFRIGPYPFVLVTQAELAHEVYVTHQGSFHKGVAMQRARALLGNGLLTSEEPLHMRQRRILQPAFEHHRLEEYAAAVANEALRRRDAWSHGSTIEAAREMTWLTVAVITRTLFSVPLRRADIEAIGAAVDDALRAFDAAAVALGATLMRLPLPRTRRFLRARDHLDRLVTAIVAERRTTLGERPGERDALSLLLENVDVTERQLRDEVLTLLLAGHETVAYALAWALYLVATHPEAERRLHAEIDEVLDGRAPGAGDLRRLPYTRCVIAEALRLYPPSWINSRRAVEDVELNGTSVKRGDNVAIVLYLLHRDRRHWPQPERFDPARFAPDAERSRARTAYVPFGAGKRRCIGRDFALMEMALVLAAIAQVWRLRPLTPEAVRVHPQFTLRPRGGMPMRLERRSGVSSPR